MKIRTSNDAWKLVLSNNQGKEISFSLSDHSIHQAIQRYIEKKSPEGANVKTVMFSQNQKFLVFDSGYTIKLTDAAHFEISNRMVLLNQELTCALVNDIPSLEEIEDLG
jgi:rRNA maturation protein Rpf1